MCCNVVQKAKVMVAVSPRFNLLSHAFWAPIYTVSNCNFYNTFSFFLSSLACSFSNIELFRLFSDCCSCFTLNDTSPPITIAQLQILLPKAHANEVTIEIIIMFICFSFLFWLNDDRWKWNWKSIGGGSFFPFSIQFHVVLYLSVFYFFVFHYISFQVYFGMRRHNLYWMSDKCQQLRVIMRHKTAFHAVKLSKIKVEN